MGDVRTEDIFYPICAIIQLILSILMNITGIIGCSILLANGNTNGIVICLLIFCILHLIIYCLGCWPFIDKPRETYKSAITWIWYITMLILNVTVLVLAILSFNIGNDVTLGLFITVVSLSGLSCILYCFLSILCKERRRY